MSTDAPQAEPTRSAPEIVAWLRARIEADHGIPAAELDPKLPFTTHGLGSIDLLTLTGELARWLGRTLAGDLLFEQDTIARVASFLAGDTVEEASELVPLTDGEGTPLFLVHSVAGEVLCWKELAAQLADRPVLALQQPASGGDGPHVATVEELATRYATLLHARQPEGAFHLAGHCYGSRVAFETARVLTEDHGREVAFLGILDGLPTRRPRVGFGGFLRALPRILWNLPGWVWRNARAGELGTILGPHLALVRWKAKRAVRSLLTLPGAKKAHRLLTSEDRRSREATSAEHPERPVPDAYQLQYDTNVDTWVRYRPARFAGTIDFFRPRTRQLYELLLPPDGGWGRHASDVRLHALDGDHDAMIYGERAAELANVLRARLRDAG